MTGEKSSQQDKEIELLKFNYQSLHESALNLHRVPWLVTSIFMPVLFAMLGYLIREYNDISKFQVAMGFLVMEGLLFIWWLIIRWFEHYNYIRIAKLKEIEDRLNEIIPGVDFEAYNLAYGEVPRELKFQQTRIHKILFGLYTVLNLGFLLAKLISG